MTLARASDDPALKQYYEELALKFAQYAANEHDDPDNISWRVSPIAATPIGTGANKPSAIYPRYACSRTKNQ